MASKWKKIAKNISASGTTTITYMAVDHNNLFVQSRKRQILHANGIGSWTFTSYFVIRNGIELKELNSLRDAKEWAEHYEEEYYGK